MNVALADLPAHLRRRLISGLETGALPLPCQPAALRPLLGANQPIEAVAEALGELAVFGLTPRAAAEWLRALERVTALQSVPSLVWSGPEVPGLHARDTRRVYDELFGSAERSVWASTYVFLDGPKAFRLLAQRMDSISSLQVHLLLNIQRKRGDTTTTDTLIRRFADRFWTHEWPGSARPTVYYDPRALDPDSRGGVLHAKAVTVDEEVVFVTSANLTEAALDRNIEVGLLFRDRALALSLTHHFQRLIDTSLLRPLPME